MVEYLTDEKLKTKAGDIEIDETILDLAFNEIKENSPNKLAKYVERWEELGFIIGLKEDIKERTAFAMEQLAIYLITNNEPDETFELIGFPMIRRIIAGSVVKRSDLNNVELFNFKDFIKLCNEIDFNKFINDIHSITAGVKIDNEAEACALGCEAIIHKFNGDERNINEIKDELLEEIKEKIIKRYEGIGSDNTNA